MKCHVILDLLNKIEIWLVVLLLDSQIDDIKIEYQVWRIDGNFLKIII